TVNSVDAPPVAVSDAATVTEADPSTAINALTNDTDTDALPNSLPTVTQPANGTVVITGGGTGLTYQPAANYCNNPPGTSPDTFTNTRTHVCTTPTVTVSMPVYFAHNPPFAFNDAATMTENDRATAFNV